ncbi:MAG: glycoside hydrolase family 3 N-terminal domain-containing protein [Protaetiibacter sp.]
MTISLHDAPFRLDARGIAWVETTLASLSLEQKVGQLMCLYLARGDAAEWSDWLLARRLEPGAMMMTPRPPAEAGTAVRMLQERSGVPLLFSGNLESGVVNFLAGTEAFANPMQLAATGDPSAAEELARHCARVADEIGINWAFAPVIDIAINPGNPITNTRTFGSDPETVAAFGSAYIRAMESRGIATSAKHFPGDGVDDRDQHLVTSANDLDTETWWATFGQVYRAAIEAGTRTIMVGHIRQRALSLAARPELAPREIMPATLAPELLEGVLRSELGFAGLVVSDNSAMTGFSSVLPREEALPRMIAAGVDMLLGNVDVEDDYRILLDAARTGAIGATRLDEAVMRVLAVKASIGLHDGVDRRERPHRSPGEDEAARRDIARRSVTLVKDTQELLPLDPTRHRRALVYVVGDEPTFYDPSGPFSPQFIAGLEARGLDVEVRTVPGNSTTPAEAARLHETFDVCIYFANVRFIGNSNTLRLTWSPWQGWDAPRHVAKLPTALVSIADPYLLRDVPMIRTAINGYTPTPATVDAVLEVLFGELEASGRSPVDPLAGRWDAAL